MRFSIRLGFDRPTKRTVRFAHEDFGVLYVPNDVFRDLGHPSAVKMTLEAEPVSLDEAPAAEPPLRAVGTP